MFFLIRLVNNIVDAILLLLTVRAVFSWIPTNIIMNYNFLNMIYEFIINITEPILLPMRNLFNRLGINSYIIDFSFLATFIAIQFIGRFIIMFLYKIIFF